METTYFTKKKDLSRDWLVIDAKDMVVGRLATNLAMLASASLREEAGTSIVIPAGFNLAPKSQKEFGKLLSTRYDAPNSNVEKTNRPTKEESSFVNIFLERFSTTGLHL